MQLTFEQLPTAVSGLYAKLENIERLLLKNAEPRQNVDQWFDLTQFCDYHPEKPAKATAYAWVSKGEIPFHKRGKKLFFLKSEIDAWLKNSRRKTLSEIDAEADFYLETGKTGR